MAKITKSFTGTGDSTAIDLGGDFSVSISGTFDATVNLQRSFDDGATWHTIEAFTDIAEKVGIESSTQVKYRFNCSSFASGTAVAGLYK